MRADPLLWVSEHIWRLSLICDTAAPLDRAESKRWLSRQTGVFRAVVVPAPVRPRARPIPWRPNRREEFRAGAAQLLMGPRRAFRGQRGLSAVLAQGR